MKILFDKHIHIRHSKYVNVKIKREDDTLLVSNVTRRDGKQFHRNDNNFEPIEPDDLENVGSKTAVIMHVSCASHTSVCQNECGYIIKDALKNLTDCPTCLTSLGNSKQCVNCDTQHSPQWCKWNTQTL